MSEISENKRSKYPAKVAHVGHSNKEVIINRGEEDGIRMGQRFLVYQNTKDEIKDPDTGESLGFWEWTKGTGKVVNVQKKMSTIRSDMEVVTEPTYTRYPVQTIRSFEHPEVGDLVKPI